MDRLEFDQINNDIYSLFGELGDTTHIKYKRLVKTGDNFYDEKPQKTYLADITLTALVSMSPQEEDISPIGKVQGCQVVFTLSAQELTTKKLMAKDVHKLSLDDAISYNNEMWKIVNIVPRAIIIGIPLLYKIEVKRDV